jgi:hypothetical protein
MPQVFWLILSIKIFSYFVPSDSSLIQIQQPAFVTQASSHSMPISPVACMAGEEIPSVPQSLTQVDLVLPHATAFSQPG